MKKGLYRTNDGVPFYYTGKSWYSWWKQPVWKKPAGSKIVNRAHWMWEGPRNAKMWFKISDLRPSNPLEFLLLTGDVYKPPPPVC